MNYRGWLASLCLSLTFAVVAAPGQAVTPELVEIEDADTLRVVVASVSYRIQLIGIDAPESSMNPKLQHDMQRTGLAAKVLLPLGHAANGRLRELLTEFRPYRLVFDPQRKDRYGRTPGDLIDAKGNFLSLRLVQEGYAIPVGPPETRKQVLVEAANSALQASRGLWHSYPETANAWAGIGSQ